MGAKSSIEWTEATWNPVTGCSKISAGCKHCYAERMAKRLKAMGQSNYVRGFEVAVHERTLDLPLRWRKPRTIFVNSMSDLFHEKVPTDFIMRVFDVMNRASGHLFQVLTKRSRRLLKMSADLPWAANIWMGVTTENPRCLYRADDLRQTGAWTKFLSVEPLLSPIPRLDLEGIDWVIVGGESGPHSRAMRPEWVRDIRDNCRREGVPFFFKQWGGTNKKKAGRILDGRTWDQAPPPPQCPATPTMAR